MKRIFDQIVLLTCCTAAAFSEHTDSTIILTVCLCTIIYLSITYTTDSRFPAILSACCYALLLLCFQISLLFFPVLLYHTVRYRAYTLTVLSGLAAVLFPYRPAPAALLYLAVGIGLSLLLQFHSETYERLEKQYKQTRDDSTELNLLLKQKNASILQKQDEEIYTATLKERNRIAREIHDNVGHMLSRSILMTGAMKMQNKDSVLTESLNQMENTLHAAMTSVRESVHNLHDDSVDLKKALTELVNTFTFCPVQLDYDMGLHIPHDIKYSYIAIVKEGLHNILKHSNATCVHIIAREHPGLYQLSIADNGTKSAVILPHSGLGLTNLNDRTQALGGNIQIQTDSGFRIFITLPKKENDYYEHTDY